MAGISNIKLPKIDIEQLNNSDYTKKIANYLLSLEENMRYMFGNIDDENVTKKFIDDLTVQHLNVTNGDNSIVASPESGFQMFKGRKKMFDLNLITGEAEFEGKITASSGFIGGWEITEGNLRSTNGENSKFIGGSIQSENYVENLSGMYINLTNGLLDTAKTKILEDGTIITDGITIKNGSFNVSASGQYDAIIKLSFEDYYTSLMPYGFSTWIDEPSTDEWLVDITPDQIFIGSPTNESRQTIIEGRVIKTPSLFVLGSPAITVSNKNNYTFPVASHNHGSIDTSFATVDGKTITVTNGIVTAVN